jgi:acyl-CoA thioesterase-1
VNPLILYFVSGESLYSGTALLIFTAVSSSWLSLPYLRRVRNLAAWIGLLMIFMACPPFPWIADAAVGIAFGMWYSIWNMKSTTVFVRNACSAALVILLVALTISELPHRNLPVIAGVQDNHLAILGDSISAGLDSRVPSWPLILVRRFGVPVKNLSRVGATTEDAIAAAASLTAEDHLVLIEIGGNDLIANVPSMTFEKNLEALLRRVSGSERTVVMFELPLLPHKISYGRIQRRLARQYGVWLIPKKYLISVIRGSNATSDGLHLTIEGTQRMADLVEAALSPLLVPAQWK